MNAQQHFYATNAEFLHCFGLSLEEAGIDPGRFLHTYGDLTSRDAALEAGSDYGRAQLGFGWRQPLPSFLSRLGYPQKPLRSVKSPWTT